MKLSPMQVFSCKHPQRSQQHLDPSDKFFKRCQKKFDGLDCRYL